MLDKGPCSLILLSVMTRIRLLLICFSLLGIGGGIYFAQNSFLRAWPGSEHFLSGLLAVANPNILGSNEPAQEVGRPGNGNDVSSVPVKPCAFETVQTPLHSPVLISEIAWMGTAENAKNEWIELKNISSEATAIGNWQLINQNGKIKIIFGNGAKILFNGFYLLGTEKNIGAGTDADVTYRGVLKNSGDSLRLFDNNCRLIDEVVAASFWPAGDNAAKKTMERDPETFLWHTAAIPGGTAKKENTFSSKPSAGATAKMGVQAADSQQSTTTVNMSIVVPATANKTETSQSSAVSTQPSVCSPNSIKTLSRSALINEVAWAGVASDKTSEEWIELKNNSGANIFLDGWQMQNANQSVKIFFAAPDSIPAGGFWLLERGSADFMPGVKADKFFTNAIKNSDEAIRLFDKNCNVVDEVTADVGTDKNWPAGVASPDYRTAERSSDLSWHSYGGSGANGVFGTPRAENSPQPVSVNIASVASQSQSSPLPPPAYYTIQFSKSGNGAGSVTSNPSGISCASSCITDSKDFVSGTAVSLSAFPADNSEFAGWFGDCSGIGACLVSMTSAKSVSAVFNQVISSAPPSSFSLPSDIINHLLISEIMIGVDNNSSYTFVEFYNPASGPVDLTGWVVKKKTSTGTESSLVVSDRLKDTIVQPGKYFLTANDTGYTGSVLPDVKWPHSYSLAYTNNAVAIYNNLGEKVEEVGWTSILKNQSYERDSWTGNGFHLQTAPNPQNSQSQ